MLYQREKYIEKWESGLVDGGRGIVARNLSAHIISYLRDNYGDKCALCGWGVKHPVTERVPLEIDHIDGNPENNKKDNLRFICPNCHSLSPHYKNLNKGNGRQWRMAKYIKNDTE